MTSKYKMMGMNSDQTFCACCGKENLARVVWLQNLETEEISHYGTICAGKLISPDKIKKVQSRITAEQVAELRAKINTISDEIWKENPIRKDFNLKFAMALLPLEDQLRSLKIKDFLQYVINYKKGFYN